MSRADSPHSRTAPGWYWPDDVPKDEASSSGADIPHASPRASSSRSSGPSNEAPPPGQGTQSSRRRRHWAPRQCRICFDTVQPTTHIPSEHIPGFLQQPPKVTYEDENGRLIRPCLCKGGSKYVHEGCLQAWRHADPSNRRNYFECPTCKFSYRLDRMGWANWVASRSAQVVLTALILLVAVFFLGFVADPIINMYVDPWSYLSPWSWGSSNYYYEDEESSSWAEHFAKGFAGMGVLGFAKVLIASPFNYIRFGGGGRRRGGRVTGRDRVEQVSWLVILVGVMTVMGAIYKGVRAWSRRTLEKAGERVMDVQQDDDDDDDED